MANPILDKLGPLLVSTSRQGQEKPAQSLGPTVTEDEEVIYQPGPAMSTEQLVPLLPPKQKPQSIADSFGKQKIWTMEPAARFKAMGQPAEPIEPVVSLGAELLQERRSRPLQVGDIAGKDTRAPGFLQTSLDETILRESVADDVTQQALVEESKLQRKRQRINSLLQMRKEDWSHAELQFMIDEAPKGITGDTFSPVSGDDEANLLRNREEIRKAVVLQSNPWLQSIVDGTSLRHIWLEKVDDIKLTLEGAYEAQRILNHDFGNDDPEKERRAKANAGRGLLEQLYGQDSVGTDSTGKKILTTEEKSRFARLWTTDEEVLEKLGKIVSEDSVTALAELQRRKEIFVRDNLGASNLLSPDKVEPSSVDLINARDVPPLHVMAKAFIVRYQKVISPEDLFEKDPDFQHILRLYGKYKAAPLSTETRKAAAAQIFNAYHLLFKMPSKDIDYGRGISDTAWAQLFNYSIPVPASNWDGFTWEIDGRPVVPIRDDVFFQAISRIEENIERKGRVNPNLYVTMSPTERRRFRFTMGQLAQEMPNRYSNFDATREFDIAKAGEKARWDILKETADIYAGIALPTYLQQAISNQGANEFQIYNPLTWLSIFPSKEELITGRVPGVPDSSRFLPVNDLAAQKTNVDFISNVLAALSANPESAMMSPHANVTSTFYKLVMAHEDARDATHLEKILSMRQAMSLEKIQTEMFSPEWAKANAMMLRSFGYHAVYFLGKTIFEGFQQTTRGGAHLATSGLSKAFENLESQYEAAGMKKSAADMRYWSEAFQIEADELQAAADEDLRVMGDAVVHAYDHFTNLFTDYNYFMDHVRNKTALAVIDLMAPVDILFAAARAPGVLAAATARTPAKAQQVAKASRASAASARQAGKEFVAGLKDPFQQPAAKIDVPKDVIDLTRAEPTVGDILKERMFTPEETPGVDVLVDRSTKRKGEKNAWQEIADIAEAESVDPAVRALKEAGREDRVLAARKAGAKKKKVEDEVNAKIEYEKWYDQRKNEGKSTDLDEVLLSVSKGDLTIPEAMLPEWVVDLLHTANKIDSFNDKIIPKGPSIYLWNRLKDWIQSSASRGSAWGRLGGALLLSRQEQLGPAFKMVLEKGVEETMKHLFVGEQTLLRSSAMLHLYHVNTSLGGIVDMIADGFGHTKQTHTPNKTLRLKDTPEIRDAVKMIFGPDVKIHFLNKKKGTIRIKKADGKYVTFMEADKTVRRFTDPWVIMLMENKTFRRMVLHPESKQSQKFFKGTFGKSAKETVEKLREKLKNDPLMAQWVASPEAMELFESGKVRDLQARVREAFDLARGGGDTNIYVRVLDDATGDVYNVPHKEFRKVTTGEAAGSKAAEAITMLLNTHHIKDPKTITLEYSISGGKKVRVGLDQLGIVEQVKDKWIISDTVTDILNEVESALAITSDDITNETLSGRFAWFRQAHDEALKTNNNGIFVVVKNEGIEGTRYVGGEPTELLIPSLKVVDLETGEVRQHFSGSSLDKTMQVLGMGMEEHPVFYGGKKSGHAEQIAALFENESGSGIVYGTRGETAKAYNKKLYPPKREERPAFISQRLAGDRFTLEWANGPNKGTLVTKQQISDAYKRRLQSVFDMEADGVPVLQAAVNALEDAIIETYNKGGRGESGMAAVNEAFGPTTGATGSSLRSQWVEGYILDFLEDQGILAGDLIDDAVFRIDFTDTLGNRLKDLAKSKQTKKPVDWEVKVKGYRVVTPHVAIDLKQHPLGKPFYADPNNAGKAAKTFRRKMSGGMAENPEVWADPAVSEFRAVERAADVATQASKQRKYFLDNFDEMSAHGDPIGAIRKGFASMDGMARVSLAHFLRTGEMPMGLMKDKVVGTTMLKQWEDAGLWEGDLTNGRLTTLGVAARMLNYDLSRQFYQTLFGRAAITATKSFSGPINRLWNLTDLLGAEYAGVMHMLEEILNDVKGGLAHDIARHFSAGMYKGKGPQVAADMFNYFHRAYLDVFRKEVMNIDSTTGVAGSEIVKKAAPSGVVVPDLKNLNPSDIVADDFFTAAAITQKNLRYRMGRLELLHQQIQAGNVLPGVLKRAQAGKEGQYYEIYEAPGKSNEWVELNTKHTGVDDEAGRIVFGEIWGGTKKWYIRRHSADVMRVSSEMYSDLSGHRLVGRAQRAKEASEEAAVGDVYEAVGEAKALEYKFKSGFSSSVHRLADTIEWAGKFGDQTVQSVKSLALWKQFKLFHAMLAPIVRNSITNIVVLSYTNPSLVMKKSFWDDLLTYSTEIRPGMRELAEHERYFFTTGLGGGTQARGAGADIGMIPATQAIKDFWAERMSSARESSIAGYREVYGKLAQYPDDLSNWEKLNVRVSETLNKAERRAREISENAHGTAALGFANKAMNTFIDTLARLNHAPIMDALRSAGQSRQGLAFGHFMTDVFSNVFGVKLGKTRLEGMDRFTKATANLFSLGDEAFKYAIWKDLWHTKGPGAAIKSGRFRELGAYGDGTFVEWWNSPKEWRNAERKRYLDAGYMTPEMIRATIADFLPDYSYATAALRFTRAGLDPFVYFKAKMFASQSKWMVKNPVLASALRNSSDYVYAGMFDTPEEMSLMYNTNEDTLPFMFTSPTNSWSLRYLDFGLDPYDLIDTNKWLPSRVITEILGPFAVKSKQIGSLEYSGSWETMWADILRATTNVIYGSGMINPVELLYRRLTGLGYNKYGVGKHEVDQKANDLLEVSDKGALEKLAAGARSAIEWPVEQIARMGIEAGGPHFRKFGAAYYGTPYKGTVHSKSLTPMDYTNAFGNAFFGLTRSRTTEPLEMYTRLRRELGAKQSIEKLARQGGLSPEQLLFQYDLGTLEPEVVLKIQHATGELDRSEAFARGAWSKAKIRKYLGSQVLIDMLPRIWMRRDLILKHGGDQPFISEGQMNVFRMVYPGFSDEEIIQMMGYATPENFPQLKEQIPGTAQ